jgi:hypothetical protein
VKELARCGGRGGDSLTGRPGAVQRAMTLDQWRQLDEAQRRKLVQQWPLPHGPPPDEPPWAEIEDDFRHAYPHLEVRGFGNVHGSTMLVVMRPFIFDQRGTPTWHLGVPVRYTLTEPVPPDFEVSREYVWAPENYLNFVDQHADLIREKLNDPSLSREDMLEALIGMPFDDWIDQCRKHPHNTNMVRGQRVLTPGK